MILENLKLFKTNSSYFKIKNFRLKLENYTLNAGICESFAKAISIFPEILDSITLAYNGLKDIDLQTIL
jgi:hypothetical protein